MTSKQTLAVSAAGLALLTGLYVVRIHSSHREVPLRLVFASGQRYKTQTTLEGWLEVTLPEPCRKQLDPSLRAVLGSRVGFKVETAVGHCVKDVASDGSALVELRGERGTVEMTMQGEPCRETFDQPSFRLYRALTTGGLLPLETSKGAGVDALMARTLPALTQGYLPSNPVRAGETWKQPLAAPLELGLVKVVAEGGASHTLKELRERSGQRFAEIASTVAVKLAEAKNAASVSVRGDLQARGTTLLDTTGGTETHAEQEGDLNLSVGFADLREPARVRCHYKLTSMRSLASSASPAPARSQASQTSAVPSRHLPHA